MASNIETQRFAAKANIFRYQKLLATYLTEEERRFVERRLEEEKAALQQYRRRRYGLPEAIGNSMLTIFGIVVVRRCCMNCCMNWSIYESGP